MRTYLSRKLALAAALAMLAACGSEPETPSTPAAASPAAQVPPPAANTAQAVTSETADCEMEQGVYYICGPQGAEDLLSLGSTGLILASGMSSENTPGHMYLIDPETREVSELVHSASFSQAHDAALFPNCPGQLNLEAFSVHGLSIDEVAPGLFSIYTTSHGEREAIEVYELDMGQQEPALTWKGCVVLPENTFANSVARLDDGGFVTTKMMDPSAGFASIANGGITGLVYEWHPGGEVFPVEGTELSGANGIAVSEDERYMFVAAFGTREIIRFDRSTTPVAKESVSVDITPDNIRWGSDGKLLTAGGNYVAPEVCSGQGCATGWSVLEIDADTLEVTRIGGADETAALHGVSTALQVGDQYWVGSFNDDRIGWFAVP